MKEKIKVLAYIYRNEGQDREVLAFSHREFPEVGLQVIGGTVDPGEDLIDALIREIYEESGLLVPAAACSKIGETIYFRKDKPEKNHRHYFKVDISGLPESWTHTVESNGADNGVVFDYHWLLVSKARELLDGNMGELLS